MSFQRSPGWMPHTSIMDGQLLCGRTEPHLSIAHTYSSALLQFKLSTTNLRPSTIKTILISGVFSVGEWSCGIWIESCISFNCGRQEAQQMKHSNSAIRKAARPSHQKWIGFQIKLFIFSQIEFVWGGAPCRRFFRSPCFIDLSMWQKSSRLTVPNFFFFVMWKIPIF